MMLQDDPNKRISSRNITSQFSNKFDKLKLNLNGDEIKYSPVQTYSKIDITVENKNQIKNNYYTQKNFSIKNKPIR